MRKNVTDCYESVAIIGTDSYSINFMNYLIQSQNINSWFNPKCLVDNKSLNSLKNIAYYFGTRGPILIDNEGLRKIFDSMDLLKDNVFPVLNFEDIINQINECLNSDVVYVCNVGKELEKSMMFTLGFLMAKNQEIFFWNEIDESEWLMSSILDKTSEHFGIKDIVEFPLEFVRTIAFPYIIQKKDNNIKNGVERNTGFNLPLSNNLEQLPNTVCLLGSLKKQLDSIKNQAKLLQDSGYIVLAPKLSNIKSDKKGFIIFEDDKDDDPIMIETDFLDKCMSAEKLIVCDEGGYVGNTVMFEIGYLLGRGKSVELIEQPKEEWLLEVISYFSNNSNNKRMFTK